MGRTCVLMAVREPALRQRARALREQGWALRHIANEVEAALSTVSLWVRDVQLAVEATPALPTPASSSGSDNQTVVGSRRCGHCLRDLPLTSFNLHPSGRQWWCRDCYQEYFRARAQRHRDQVSAARRARRRAARAFISGYLRTRCCSDCGEADPLVLEFHHLEQKRGNVTDMVRLDPRSELSGENSTVLGSVCQLPPDQERRSARILAA